MKLFRAVSETNAGKTFGYLWQGVIATVLIGVITIPVLAQQKTGDTLLSTFAAERKKREDDVVYTPIINPRSSYSIDYHYEGGYPDDNSTTIRIGMQATPTQKIVHAQASKTDGKPKAQMLAGGFQFPTLTYGPDYLSDYQMPPSWDLGRLQVSNPVAQYPQRGALVTLRVQYDGPNGNRQDLSSEAYRIEGRNGVLINTSYVDLKIILLPEAVTYLPAGQLSTLHIVARHDNGPGSTVEKDISVFRH